MPISNSKNWLVSPKMSRPSVHNDSGGTLTLNGVKKSLVSCGNGCGRPAEYHLNSSLNGFEKISKKKSFLKNHSMMKKNNFLYSQLIIKFNFNQLVN